MVSLTYNLSPTLVRYLDQLESVRRQIILTPISPKTEIRLRWETLLNRIHSWLLLSGTPLSKSEVVGSLTGKTVANREVLRFRRAVDFISQNWLVNPKPVTPTTLVELGHRPSASDKNVLDYLQTGSVHPLIQAGLAYLYFPTRVGALTGLLFLAKAGMDFRGLFCPEIVWIKEKDHHFRLQAQAQKAASQTLWLEYFARSALEQLWQAASWLSDPRWSTDIPQSFFALTKRQQAILALLNQPHLSITNKMIQSAFKVSQITASRDLSKLATLGLLFPRGSGRSTSYTRA